MCGRPLCCCWSSGCMTLIACNCNEGRKQRAAYKLNWMNQVYTKEMMERGQIMYAKVEFNPRNLEHQTSHDVSLCVHILKSFFFSSSFFFINYLSCVYCTATIQSAFMNNYYYYLLWLKIYLKNKNQIGVLKNDKKVLYLFAILFSSWCDSEVH